MDQNQLHIFSKAFFEANYRKAKLPKKFRLDQVNEIEFYSEGMRGGCTVRFFIRKNSSGEWFMDLFGGDDYVSWHRRIHQNGEITDLENFQGRFGKPFYSDDPERTAREHREIQENNDRVHQLLIEKGLEKP
ncbi:hypothetical protein [Fluviicola sp.]|uniref:hypothetical protein n=1 Tax=Fluviicola sp. TaxID=1917219 RepID=UPI0031D28D1C